MSETIQRYRFILEHAPDGSIMSADAVKWYGSQAPKNDWVAFADHERLLAQAREEAAELAILRDAVVAMEPALAKKKPDGSPSWDDFDGYFVHWDEIERRVSAAWPGGSPGYSESPAELITDLIDERDMLKEQVAQAREEGRQAAHQCEHDWVLRIDGHEEGCSPAICTKCGLYGCWCDAIRSRPIEPGTSEGRFREFKARCIPGNDHEIEKRLAAAKENPNE